MPQTEPTIITTAPECRQIAQVLYFEPPIARHIAWDSIATTARECGAHFEARWTDAGACTVTIFWTYEDEGTR